MSEQPNALRLADELDEHVFYGDQRLLHWKRHSPLATKAAAELRRLHQVELAFNTWLEKTEWVQHTAEPGELGLHRADLLKQRIEELTEELTVMREMNNG